MSIAVFDIDGVVADVRHRLHHLQPPRSWGKFFREASEDPLLVDGAAVVVEAAATHKITWLTGRPEFMRSTTADWLAEHDLPAGTLRMRPARDHRPASQYKLEVLRWLGPHDIAMFFDDDAAVIDAARAAGFPGTLADWVPRESLLRDAQERFGRT